MNPMKKILTAYRALLTATAGAVLMALASCSDSTPTVNLGIDDTYRVARMSKLPLHPELTGDRYEWRVNGNLVSTDRDYIFVSAAEGVFDVTLDIIDADTPYHHDFRVTVMHEEVEYSPWISKVYEYRPAPGQFVNEMPQYDPGDDYEAMLAKVTECITGTADVMISLGAYGGYVTFGFDHTVMNMPGQKDFRIWGNAFYELLDQSHKGGSAEPGIVMVSFDANCNGVPDDEWYELRGSEYVNPLTLHGYSITYTAPDPDATPVPDDSGTLSDTRYIPWRDSTGATGYVARNAFHSQSYWPLWLDDTEMTFSGSCLPPNATDLSGNGTYYVLYSYGHGYVDNHPNEFADLNSFDISDAVDARGNPVTLPGADFIRVYTGLNQYCGWLGETSTELSKAQDLHISLLPF